MKITRLDGYIDRAWLARMVDFYTTQLTRTLVRFGPDSLQSLHAGRMLDRYLALQRS